MIHNGIDHFFDLLNISCSFILPWHRSFCSTLLNVVFLANGNPSFSDLHLCSIIYRCSPVSAKIFYSIRTKIFSGHLIENNASGLNTIIDCAQVLPPSSGVDLSHISAKHFAKPRMIHSRES